MMNISDEQRLTRMIEKYGESSRIVSMFRDQIASQKRGQSAQDMYVTGMMKREPERAK
jgi:hypothetical protein